MRAFPRFRRAWLTAPVLFLWAAHGALHAQELTVDLEPVVSGLASPIGIEHAGDGSERLFLVEQGGTIRIEQDGSLLATPFLDVSPRVTTDGNEQGLLGLAFHPDYADNGVFFIHYTEDVDGDTVIERCNVAMNNSNQGDCSGEDIIFTLPQPARNHNGGKIAFGPDGLLYIALGDGGGGGDPDENAQDITDLHGKLLRVDVNGDDFPADDNSDYAISPDNPFVGQAGADEIWAYGLRNPWRFSFDRMTGDIWIGDVGQQDWEEIDFEPANDPGGRNYGWDVLEGEHCFEDIPSGACNSFQNGGSTLPVVEIDSSGTGNCSVTGGFRYRGVNQPELFGYYLYGDFCSGRIWGVLPDCSGGWVNRELADTNNSIASFGEDEAGELYLVDRADGTLYRVVAAAGAGGPALSPTPTGLDYGAGHQVGDSATQSADLVNAGTGSDDLVIEAFALSDTDHFQLDTGGGVSPCGPAPVCLASGESCTVAVTFAPLREGGFDEFLTGLANSAPAPVSLLGEVACTGPDNLTLDNQNVNSDSFFTACLGIATGPAFSVGANVAAELRAGERVTLGAGTAVAQGASLSIAIDPVLTQ